MDTPPLLSAARIFTRHSSWKPAATVVAVGNFDGVHLGHAAIVRRLRAAADRLGVPAVAFTFDPHPASVVRPGAAPPPLTTPQRRADLLLDLGIDAVLVQPTDERLVGLEAEAFYAVILRDGLRARAIVEGEDFHFGARRRGDVQLLGALCRVDGIPLDVVPPVLDAGVPVSSSRLRDLIAGGEVATATRLMTSAYRLSGTVVAGARRGRTLGFPTANLAEIATLLPGNGVYAAVAVLPDGSRHAAAVHIGPNASFAATQLSVEAHLLGYAGDLYGHRLDVDFLTRLRDTRRFGTVEDLKAQLAVDVADAAKVAATVGIAADIETATPAQTPAART